MIIKQKKRVWSHDSKLDKSVCILPSAEGICELINDSSEQVAALHQDVTK